MNDNVFLFRRPRRRVTLTIDWDEQGIAHFSLDGHLMRLYHLQKFVDAVGEMVRGWRAEVEGSSSDS